MDMCTVGSGVMVCAEGKKEEGFGQKEMGGTHKKDIFLFSL